jgi:hypothetical protein
MFAQPLIRRVRKTRIVSPEIAERKEYRHAAISVYLEGLVRRGLMPRPIAEAIHARFPEEEVQREVVALFWATQRAQAWDYQCRHRKLWRVTWKTAGFTMAAFSALMFIKGTRFSHSADAPILRPMPPVAVVHLRPTIGRRPSRSVRSRNADVRPILPASLSTIVANFTVQSLPTGIRFSWNSMGPGYTYSLYADNEPAMRHLHKVKDRILGAKFTLENQSIRSGDSWWAITATNAYGGESPLSGAASSSP